MAIKNNIISFWKQVRLRSSDMFTLFRVGVGIKVPTNKLHVKDSADPIKVEGITSKTLTSTDVTSYNILQADSNGVFYKTNATGGIAIDELYDKEGNIYLSGQGGSDGQILLRGAIRFEGSTDDEYETTLRVEDPSGSDKTLTLPNLTGTIATTDVAGGGTGASTFTSNAILTGNGTSAIQSESSLTYTGEVLTIGDDDDGFASIQRFDHTDGAGGSLQLFAGAAGGDNTAGGSVKIYAGYGKGSGGGGDIQFISNGTSGTASTTPTPAVVAVISKEGNLQIDGGLTTGSTSFVNSSGVVQVATQGTIDHDSLANFVANEHIDWTGASAGTIHATNYTNTTYSEATGSAEGLMSIAHHDKLDGIEAGATADQTQADINGLAITTVGTVDTGTWQGTAIASAYLDSDTAHLSTIQTFTGEKTFERKVILDGNKIVTAGGDGVTLHVDAQNITDNSTSASGTATFFNHIVIENPSLIATNASVTTTNASTLYIKGAPTASTNQTITNAYALNVAGGDSYFGGAITATGIITGKQRQIYQQSFIDDLATTKHYLPWRDTDEQTTIYQEEAAMVAPYDGRIVSVTIRMSSIATAGNRTIGIHTFGPNSSQFSSGSWTEEEVETVAIENTDDNHVFYFVFDNAKHFESGELVVLSIQDDADLHSGQRYTYVSTVVEWDYNNGLGTGASSAEYDSAQ